MLMMPTCQRVSSDLKNFHNWASASRGSGGGVKGRLYFSFEEKRMALAQKRHAAVGIASLAA
jgi:hypothetical protein